MSPFATDLVPVALGVGLPVTATFHCVIDRSAGVFRAAGPPRALGAPRRRAQRRVDDGGRPRVRGGPGAVVEVVPNGVDAAWWRPRGTAAPASDGRRPGIRGAVHVVSAMRLVTRKRPLATLAVLRGARAILDPAVPLRATIVGEGPQRRLMERYLRTRGMDWVDLPGRVGREELRRLHQRRDVYLTTARLEAFGIAALEARAAGVPVVAPRGTGVDDFVEDGVEGLLADTDVETRRRAGPPGRRRRPARRGCALTCWPPRRRRTGRGVLAATLAEYRRAGAPAA